MKLYNKSDNKKVIETDNLHEDTELDLDLVCTGRVDLPTSKLNKWGEDESTTTEIGRFRVRMLAKHINRHLIQWIEPEPEKIEEAKRRMDAKWDKWEEETRKQLKVKVPDELLAEAQLKLERKAKKQKDKWTWNHEFERMMGRQPGVITKVELFKIYGPRPSPQTNFELTQERDLRAQEEHNKLFAQFVEFMKVMAEKDQSKG